MSACGDDDDSATTEASGTEAPGTDAPGSAPATVPPAIEASDTEPPGTTAAPDPDGTAPAGGSTVKLADSDFGQILVDAEGRTLYMYMPDAHGPSTCTGGCLEAWPSLGGPAAAGEGVDGALVGTATRPDDSSEQVTYGGWPLYYFAGDAAPGEVNGQGSGDVWYVVGADGVPIDND